MLGILVGRAAINIGVVLGAAVARSDHYAVAKLLLKIVEQFNQNWKDKFVTVNKGKAMGSYPSAVVNTHSLALADCCAIAILAAALAAEIFLANFRKPADKFLLPGRGSHGHFFSNRYSSCLVMMAVDKLALSGKRCVCVVR
jgi:hypothetical protein